MELQLQNSQQHYIADLLWEADSTESVEQILVEYGRDAVIVYNMMMAEFLDSQQETDQALELINRIKGAGR